MNCLLLGELQIKVKINLLRIIDENNILKNYINQNSLHQIYFTLQLYTHNAAQGPIYSSNFFVPTKLFDQSIIFNYLYQDLSQDSKISLSIWSTARKYQLNNPLGSTVIQLFDDKGELRQGKFHLFIWPNVMPDIQDPSSTPGLANDENIEILDFISDKLEQCDKIQDQTSFKAQQALRFKLSYLYQLIPAAFLQIQFPKFDYPVFYNDKICTEYEQPQEISGQLTQLSQCLLIYDPDEETNSVDPLEEIYYTLKSQKQTSNQKLIPSRQQIPQIQKIVSKTFRIQIKPSEKQFMFTYRYYLIQDKKYLPYFLNSLPPQYNDEVQLQKLLNKWQRPDQAQALYLLSRQFSLNSSYNKRRYSQTIIKIIRDYAVTIIAELKDEELTYILLFLIQSLRYESQIYQSSLFRFLIGRAQINKQIASLIYWYLKTESQLIVSKQVKMNKQNQKNTKLYETFFNSYYKFIQTNNPEVYHMINKQIQFFQILKNIAKSVKKIKGDNPAQKVQCRKKLSEVAWNTLGQVRFPMDVKIILKEPIIQDCTVFKSAMAPMKLTFNTAQQKSFSFLFKSGDDLRQDQMILQMFDLMDRLLKGVKQDYKLSPYKALACSKSDGFVEFVPQTKTFQQTNLKEYLQKLVEEKSGEVMQNYVFSCAGYCAITYFFGIGDRHLQNLLICSSGKMLHIDFGFILGRDPKPYPPPIKIRKDMIQAMGGLQHENFKIFKAKCLQAFLYIRKHGKMVYNLVQLMLDSGLKDVHSQGIAKLYDKFAVGMNDTEAQKHFLMVLQQCKNAIAAIIADGIHRWASHFK